MSSEKKTLGQAIDEIVAALSALDEKARSTAIAAACAHLGLDAGQVPAPTPSAITSLAQLPQAPIATPHHQRDIRSLKEEKQPENAKEMACLVAFYLQQHAPATDRKDVVTVEDMVKYFKQAHYPLPKRIAQLLVDARHSGYFDPAERGTYRLNAVGYNLIAHALPRQSKAGK